METAIARRLQDLAEIHQLLPNEQMGARRGRSVDTALELLTEQVATVWESPKHVATLLSLDISGAFDTVHPIRLLDVLRRKGVTPWAVRWIKEFMTQRTTTLCFQGAESPQIRPSAGIPQGSPLSPILFLFYNTELLEICTTTSPGVTASGFVDDVNILAYSRSTASNCRKIEQVHQKCLAWAQRFGLKFAPQKYELIHFTRRKGFDLSANIQLEGVVLDPKPEVRVLGVWLDTKLKWKSHTREINKRMARQTLGLQRTTASTWGATFSHSRQIYNAVVRSALSFGAPSWHTASENPAKTKGIVRLLEKHQNACLRTVAGAYKATPIEALETETFTPPLPIYLNRKVAAYHLRQENSPVRQATRQACNRIRTRVLRCRHRTPPPTPAVAGELWARHWRQDAVTKEDLDKKMIQEWQVRWANGRRVRGRLCTRPPDPGVLKLHQDLYKAESSILIQVRTGKIGLADFLHLQKVPGFENNRCSCSNAPETVRHVIVHCNKENERRIALRNDGRPIDYNWLTNTNMGAKRLTKWLIQGGRLKQFSLASSLLYD